MSYAIRIIPLVKICELNDTKVLFLQAEFDLNIPRVHILELTMPTP
jgi:hypothetical protein